jgi:anti-sigma regulatory factor (Ser/Thr protein kinase)
VPRSGAAPSQDHAVLFYDDARQAVDHLASYVAEGLREGGAVVTVLRPSHSDAVREALAGLGIEPDRAVAEDRLVVLDAASTLDKLLVDGMPDPARLADHAGAVVARLGAGGRPVRAAGEMVALLWAEGNVVGALALESAWNDLARTIDFTLLCPYPAAALDSSLEQVSRLCALHTDVLVPHSYASGEDGLLVPAVTTEVFVPAPEAVGAARRLVAGAIAAWSVRRDAVPDERLVADACLVASELAGNAVTHARSAFRVSVSCSDDGVRVCVSDVGPGTAAEHRGRLLGLSGRGLAIVAGVADRWGCDAVPGGKVVWAELVVRQPVAL